MANRLETAMALYFRWQASEPREEAAEFLARHPEYAEYLGPLMQEAPPAPSLPSDERASARRILGEYHLLQEIGRGGMGIVYEAWQPSLNRRVAVKVLSPQWTHDPATLIRFRREATTAASLQHPGIAEVLEFGNFGETHYLAMQLVPGASLEQVLAGMTGEDLGRADGSQVLANLRRAMPTALQAGTETGPMDRRGPEEIAAETPPTGVASAGWDAAVTWSGGFVQTVVRLVIQVLDTLEYAHQEGVIHRDVKPSNILIRPDGRAVLADFGLARLEGSSSLSMTGDFAGSPYYVSPEQGARKSSELDRRTDLFSVGVTLFEALTLQRPFRGDSPHQVIESILKDEPPSPDRFNPGLAGDLVAIVLKALEKERYLRYQTAAAFAADLRAFLEYRPVSARRPTRLTRVHRWLRREPIKAVLVVALFSAALLAIYVLANRAATETGQQAMQRQQVDRELMEGWFASQYSREPKQAGERFRRALELDPGNPRAIFGCLWNERLFDDAAIEFLDHHAISGRGDAVLARLRKRFGPDRVKGGVAIQVDELRGLDPLEYFALGMIGLPVLGDAHAEERIETCRKLIEAAVYKSPAPRFEHFMMLASLASRMDRPDLARRSAEALLTHWQDQPLAFAAAGVAVSYVNRSWALECLEQAVRERPGLFYAQFNFALTLSADGQLDRAIETAEAALRIRPEEAQVHSVLSMIILRLAMRIEDPQSPRRRELLEESVEYGRRSVALKPGDRVFCCQLAASLERLGEVGEAWDLIRSVVKSAPKYGRAHRGVVGLARVQGNLPAQREEFERWVKVNPNGPTAHRELAEFLLAHGEGEADRDRALAVIRRADMLTQGRDPYILVTLAEVLAARGEVAFLPKLLSRAEQFFPQEEEARVELQRRITALR